MIKIKLLENWCGRKKGAVLSVDKKRAALLIEQKIAEELPKRQVR